MRPTIPMQRPGEPAAKVRDGARVPDPPGDLGPEGRAWWSAILLLKCIASSHLPIVAALGRQADRAAAFRDDINKRGAMCPNRFGHIAPNPACDMERRAHAAMASLLRELGVDTAAGRGEKPRPNQRLGAK